MIPNATAWLPGDDDDPLVAPLRILVGEPDVGTALTLEQTLHGRGYEVDTVADRTSVITRVDARSYDVVLLAWSLVGASGLEVLREIRMRYALPDLPVVLMAPGGGTDNLVRAFDRGANDFLHKPLQPDVTLVRIHNLVALRRARLELRQQAIVDALTGVFNRRYVVENLTSQIALAHRHTRPLSFCLCDIDSFKGVNDAHGHRAGDAALHAFAGALRSGLRRSDVVGRFGGDELCMVLPETPMRVASAVVDRIRGTIADTPIAVDGGSISITASFGIAEVEADTTVSSLVSSADAALYEAKLLGRNRTCTGRDTPSKRVVAPIAV